MIIDMRLPVTSSRRCEQITAFGASDVPDVKISAQIESMSGSSPGSAAPACGASATSSAAPSGSGLVAGLGEPVGRQDRRQLRRDRREQRFVARLGEHQAAVGVAATSRSRCSSRRVWLRPTIAPPMSAAPPNAKR